MNAETLHTPTLLGRIAGEEIRTRYETSETLCEVYGRVSDGRAYSVLVRKAGKGFVVRASNQRMVKQPTRTCEDYYWNAAKVTRHASLKAARLEALVRLDVLRAGG